MAQSIRALPIGMFGAVMGLAGLGLASRGARTMFGLPAWLPEVWVWLGAAVAAVLVAGYAVKLLRHPDTVRDELANPATLGFCAALPVGLTLVAGGLAPHAEEFAILLWIAGAALLVALQLFALSRWLQGGLDLAQVNGGWMILFVGGIVFPSSGLALGLGRPAAWFFGASAAAAPFLMLLVFWRALFGPALPHALRPSNFILLVPPALIYANGIALGAGSGAFMDGLFFAALPLAAALLIASRECLSWPFGAPWWAFTFPLDALATASVRYAQQHPGGAWQVLAAATLVLATAVVVLVLARTLIAFARGSLLQPPPGRPAA
jgi:tellurite resistance protein